MRKLTVLLCLVPFTGCVSPTYNYVAEAQEISEPPLNVDSTAYVGDSMLRQGKSIKHDAIYLSEDVKLGSVMGYTLKRGYYLKEGENAKSEFYLPGSEADAGEVVVGALADPFQVVRVDKKTGALCGVSVFNMETCSKNARYEKRRYPVPSADSFQQTLIYSGKAGNKIKIGYRESSGDLARPAFNNDVEYDLSESTVMGYKGARIQVLEATNEYIKYRVLQTFHAAR
jgi:hypothetical protein